MTILERILNNWPYKLIALILAIVLRVYVCNQNADTGKSSIKTVISVPIKVVRIPNGFQELSGTQTVRLTLSGVISLENLKPSDFSAVVDASNAREGDNTSLPIVVTLPPDIQNSVQIESKSPAAATVTLQQVGAITRSVRVAISSHAPAGYVFGVPSVSPSSIDLYGPVANLERVSDVMVDFSQNERLSAPMVNVALNVLPKDEKGLIVRGISISPRQVKVSVPLMKVSSVASLSISPVHTGQPAPSYEVLGIVSFPESVSVTGDPKALSDTKTVLTAPVDITGATADITKNVELTTPPGLTLVSPRLVTVTVKIGRQTSGSKVTP
jgi:YbbR domain-containing protein